MIKLTDLPASHLVPHALQKDPSIVAIAEGIATKVRSLAAERARMIIYPRIDELPEELLDILAYDMHVEWYQEDQPIEVKRSLIKDSVRVHMTKGTPAAVETAVGAVFPGARVEEWFEYDGLPYRFRVTVGVGTQLTEEATAEALRMVAQTKNLRSHFDWIVLEHNTHESLNRFTHAELAALTQYQLRNEVLSDG
ncbi:MAG: phage tail protein I [Oscillospiraceae bacterium]|nr:phage tail protein I [Oscillospiraceae bacterium]